MAKEKKPPFIIRPRFLLFVLYVIIYVGLRYRGEMVVIPLSAAGGSAYHAVMPSPQIPHWRQQLWRAVFSLPQVVEEEGRRYALIGDNLTGGAIGQMLAPYIGTAGAPPAPQGGRVAYTVPQTLPGPADSGAAGGYAVPPGGIPTNEIIDNHIQSTELVGRVAGGAAQGLNPGEKLIYAAPPGESPPAVTRR